MSKARKAKAVSDPLSFSTASEMAGRWSDEYLLSKKPNSLTTAYGVTITDATAILRSEKRKRGLAV